MAVELLITLPDSLIAMILAEWLGAGALGRLDTAFCVRSFRPHLAQFYEQLDWERAFRVNLVVNHVKRYKSVCSWILTRSLRTSHMFICSEFGQECDEVVELLLIKNMDQIRSLQMRHNQEGEDISLQHVALYCTKLERLCYAFAGEVSLCLIIAIRRNPSLKDLSLNANNSDEMEIILRTVHCPNVVNLTLHHNVHVRLAEYVFEAFPNASTVEFESVDSEALSLVSCLPIQSLLLHDLVSTGTTPRMNYGLQHNAFLVLQKLEIRGWSENSVLAAVFAHAPQLHTISLDRYEAYQQDDENEEATLLGVDILQIVSKHVGARLQVLELCLANGMPEGDLQLLATSCPNLQHLNIDFCDNSFKDETTIALLSRWPKLTYFHIHDLVCSAALLQSITKHCPQLQTLTFEKYDFNVDIADLLAFIQRATCLKLFILGVKNYPLESVAFSEMYCAQKEAFLNELRDS